MRAGICVQGYAYRDMPAGSMCAGMCMQGACAWGYACRDMRAGSIRAGILHARIRGGAWWAQVPGLGLGRAHGQEMKGLRFRFLVSGSRAGAQDGGGIMATVPCAVYNAPCTLCPVPCVLCRAQCALYPVPCTLYPVPCRPPPYLSSAKEAARWWFSIGALSL